MTRARRVPGLGQLPLPGFPADRPPRPGRAARRMSAGPTVMRPAGTPPRRPVARVTVEIERLSTGYLRYTTPAAPDWSTNVRPNALDMAKAQQAAMVAAANEAAVDRYREKRSQRPPTRATGTTDVTGRRIFRRSHDPMAWRELPNGKLRAPGGMEYRRETQIAQRILAARARITEASTDPTPGAAE